MSSDPADPAINDFVKNPQEFLTPEVGGTAVAVSSYNTFPAHQLALPGGLPTEGYFKFVLDYDDSTTQRRTFEIRYAGSTQEENTVWAYNLGYNGGGQISRTPAFVDIPKTGVPDGTPLFTGTLSGCSVIVCDLNDTTYRVFHDAREDSSLLYDNVVMAVDYNDYSISDTGVACVFMHFQNGAWTMYTQLQTLESAGTKIVVVPRRTMVQFGLSTGYFPLIVDKDGSYDAAARLSEFTLRRTDNREQLARVATEALPIITLPNEPDGAFVPFEGRDISLSNPGVSYSQAIRKAIGESVGGTYQAYDVSESEFPILSGVLALQKANLRALVEPVRRQSENLDYVYLWLQQKAAKGLAEVVITDGKLEAPTGLTVGERFTGEQLDLMASNSPDFVSGYNNYENINIPGFSSDMSSHEMTTLFDTSYETLTNQERGALLRYIRLQSKTEFQQSVWEKTNDIVAMFQTVGAQTTPMPQDLILAAVPDEYGGRCYPLVRAMAVALARSPNAVDQIGIKLTALASDTDIKNAELLRMCLRDLHQSFPAAEASTLVGQSTLQEAINNLPTPSAGGSTIYALNTDTHAMLLGVTNFAGATSYHFYDPNFTVATFTSKDELLTGTTNFFDDMGYASVYGATGDSQNPTFTLVQIDTGKMARIGFDFKINVADIPEPETLTETLELKAPRELHLPAVSRFSSIRALGAGAAILEGAPIAQAFREAVAKLEQSASLGDNWVPIIETLSDTEGTSFQLEFINLEDTTQTRTISSDDPAIERFKDYLQDRMADIQAAYELDGGTFVEKSGVAEADAVDGLNAMFFVKTLIETYSGRKDDSGANTNSNLALALKIQSYLNLTQLGQQTLNDLSKVVALTQTLVRSEEAAQSSLSTVFRAFGRVSEGAGLLVGAANVVFDAYELSNADNEIQKAVYGTQLAFDSASFLAAAGSAGAGMVGASSAAAVLGGVTVVLAGLAVGFGALAEAFGRVAADAQTVGKYFGDTLAAYQAGGYKYDEENKVLVPLVGAVITEVDLFGVVIGQVQFDTQYIYRTQHGSTGSGYENYFFWVGDFPKEIDDKTQAISVRDGIGAPSSGILVNTGDYTTFVLPATPKSYISYEYMILPFATTRHDYGFDVIRKLEVDGRFDYDFYIFPSEYLIRRIWHEYVQTPVTIKLAEKPMRAQCPALPDVMQNYLSYTLEAQGIGFDYTIGLMAGVSLTLSTAGLLTPTTRWILDCRDLPSDTLTITDTTITVSGVTITFSGKNFAAVLVVSKTSEVSQVDFSAHTTTPVQEDGSKYPGGSAELMAHLDDLNAKHMLKGMFITVDNYTTPDGDAVGRAFYDITHKRMLYTANPPNQITKTLQLGADTTSKDEVYFYITGDVDGVWRVDPATGTTLAKYNALYPSPNRHLMRVWQEDRVQAVFRHQLEATTYGELVYALETDKMTLIAVVGDNAILQQLSTLDTYTDPPTNLLAAYVDNDNTGWPNPTDSLPGTAITATVDPQMLAVFGLDDAKNPHRYWLRFKDGAVIRPNFVPQPDIVFAGSIVEPVGGTEQFCFYSLAQQTISLQTGTGSKASAPTTVTIPSEFGTLNNVFCVNNALFALTAQGYVLRLTSDGSLFLEAVNSHWFAQFSSGTAGPWWTVLKTFAESHGATTVAVLGLQDTNKEVVPVWFCHGKYVMASISLRKQQLQIYGLATGAATAWLGIWETDANGQLYSQPVLDDTQLATFFAPTTPDILSSSAPTATLLLEGHSYKSLVPTSNGLQYTTTDGIILIVLDLKTITLYGVDKSWQSAHVDTLEEDLGTLATEWPHGEVIVMQGLQPTTAPGWYLVPAGKLLVVEVDNISWLDNPLWLGTDMNATTGYFYLVARGELYSIAVGGTGTKIGSVPLASRFDDSIVFGLPQSASFSIPTLLQARYGMAAQPTGGGTTYTVPQTSWEHYHENLFQDKNAASAADIVTLDAPNPGNLIAKRISDDLAIIDSATGRTLTIRKVWGTVIDAGFGNVSVKTSLATAITPANVVSTQTWMQSVAKLSAPPDVSLQAIDYLAQNPQS